MTRFLPAEARTELTADDVALLRHLLEEQRNFRIDQLVALSRIGPLRRSSADGAGHAEVLASLQVGARAALREVQAALWRMDEGRYGLCTECGGAIGVERLEILPHVARCVTCQRPRGQ